MPATATICAIVLTGVIASLGRCECLSYEPAAVNLHGRVERITFPGPPNYKSVATGDQAETVWVLRLAEPVCVEAARDSDGLKAAERDVIDVQLVLNATQYARYAALVGVEVQVDGTLFHAISGHHHTSVLLTVADMTRGASR